MTAKATLGGRIRAARHAAGLTLVDVAHHTGVHYTYLSKIEHGVARPSIALTRRIAKMVGMPAQRLLELYVCPTCGRPFRFNGRSSR